MKTEDNLFGFKTFRTLNTPRIKNIGNKLPLIELLGPDRFNLTFYMLQDIRELSKGILFMVTDPEKEVKKDLNKVKDILLEEGIVEFGYHFLTGTQVIVRVNQIFHFQELLELRRYISKTV